MPRISSSRYRKTLRSSNRGRGSVHMLTCSIAQLAGRHGLGAASVEQQGWQYASSRCPAACAQAQLQPNVSYGTLLVSASWCTCSCCHVSSSLQTSRRSMLGTTQGGWAPGTCRYCSTGGWCQAQHAYIESVIASSTSMLFGRKTAGGRSGMCCLNVLEHGAQTKSQARVRCKMLHNGCVAGGTGA
jgi:hypothetical protein